jgi:YD repeat-containing protein
MYLKQYDWNFAFGLRGYGRFGVISTARLPLRSDLGSPFFAETRLRKLLTKFIGTLYLQLPLSEDRTSVLFGGIDSAADLDLMTDNFMGASSGWSTMPGAANTCVTLFASRTRPASWRMDCSHPATREFTSESFENDLGLGLFVLRHSDFRLGQRFPVDFQRMYRPMDDRSRAFGVGTNHSLNIFLVGDSAHFTYIDLVQEDGARIRFKKIPPGPGVGGVFYSDGEDEDFTASTLKWNGKGWDLRRVDGWTYVFPAAGPSSTAEQSALIEIHNDKGDFIRFDRDREGRLHRVSHFEGDHLEFTYDGQNRIVHAEDSRGRYVNYSYDAQGRLVRVADSDHNIEDYTYDAFNRMLEVRWERTLVLSNVYDQFGRLVQQTDRDSRRFSYSYDASNGQMDMAHLKLPDGFVTHFYFQSGGGVTQSLPVRDHNASRIP